MLFLFVVVFFTIAVSDSGTHVLCLSFNRIRHLTFYIRTEMSVSDGNKVLPNYFSAKNLGPRTMRLARSNCISMSVLSTVIKNRQNLLFIAKFGPKKAIESYFLFFFSTMPNSSRRFFFFKGGFTYFR